METFVDDLSRWYIRRSRRRLQRPESAKDYASASATLHYALLSLVKLMAPFTPFFSEVLYAALGGAAESVHLDRWPETGRKTVDKGLLDTMAVTREFAALGLAKRAEAGVKVRQPLASLTIGTRLDNDMQKILADEVNVKHVLFDAKLKKDVRLDTAITVELREEGTLREVARMVQELRQKAGLHPKDKIILFLHLPVAAKNAVSKNEAALRSDVGAKLIEYGKSDKFNAEEATKIDGEDAWIGIRKV